MEEEKEENVALNTREKALKSIPKLVLGIIGTIMMLTLMGVDIVEPTNEVLKSIAIAIKNLLGN